MACNPLLRDPLGRFWALSVLDTGMLQTDLINAPFKFQSNPILNDNTTGQGMWQLSANTDGLIIATKVFSLPTIRQENLAYIPLLSPGGFAWNLTVTTDGFIQTISTNTLFPIIVPYIPNVTMTVFGNYNPSVICPVCNNAPVTVSADLSCWCCRCTSFVLPEDTTITVVLDE